MLATVGIRELRRRLSAYVTRVKRSEAFVPPLDWNTQPMRARVDLEDKEALHQALGER